MQAFSTAVDVGFLGIDPERLKGFATFEPRAPESPPQRQNFPP